MNKQLNMKQSASYMKQMSVQQVLDKIIWALTVYLLFSFLVLAPYTWGRYSFFITIILIFGLSILSTKGRIKIKFNAYQGFLLAFALFALLSSLWAINSSDATTSFGTLFSILICFSLVYLHYIQKDDVNSLLLAVMWAGYVVALYSIVFYGLDNIIASTTDEYSRLGNEYENVNTISFSCTTACLIQLAEFLYSKKKIFSALFAIPAVMVIAATQSRTSIILLFVGIVVLIVSKNMSDRNIKGLLKTVFSLVAIFVAVYYISKLEIFGGLNDRLEDLIKNIGSAGNGDHSSQMRLQMIELGIDIWKEHPILGVGIGNSHIIGAQYIHDTYLHNNFVELLSGGGIIGFSLYYSIYIYLFYNLWKYRKVDRKMFAICFAWLIAMLVADYGTVSYYVKMTWFYFMIQFINIEQLKRKSRSLNIKSK